MAVSNPKTKKRGGTVKKPPLQVVEPQYLPIRITADLVERIDDIRPDMIPREPFVRHLLDLIVTQIEEEG
jgi:hypothetical protein